MLTFRLIIGDKGELNSASLSTITCVTANIMNYKVSRIDKLRETSHVNYDQVCERGQRSPADNTTAKRASE